MYKLKPKNPCLLPRSLTFKAILGAATSWEPISSVIWNWLDPLSRFHEQRAGYVGADALIGDTTVVDSVFHQNRICCAAVGLGRTRALHPKATCDYCWRGRWQDLVTHCRQVVWTTQRKQKQ